jgi:F-type H+-transporting ATPase subunit gamma
MPSLRDIRKRIGSVKNIAKITSAMKMVAAAKMRKAQNAVSAARPYSEKLASVLRLVANDSEIVANPFFIKRDKIHNIALIVVSADRGLCGGFNTNVIKAAEQQIKKLQQAYPKAKIHLITVGRRVSEHFAKRPVHVHSSFVGIFTGLNFSVAQEISRIATNGFLNEEFDMVQMMVNEFVSMMRQVPRTTDFLPILPPATMDASGKIKKDKTEYIFEPSKEEVLNSLLPKHLNMQIWRGLLESNAAEQAARMFAMDNATNNSKDLTRTLTLSYNKARQAAITKEILEIVGGAEALKG